MELADSFRNFQPELRDMLRDAAAREEQDAMALGELEAQRTSAAQRMGEIETVIKQAVDEGKVSKVRLPAFERGFRARAGQDLALSLYQEKLLARTEEATRTQGRVPAQQIADEVYSEVIKTIPEGDFFARVAFDKTAQGISAGFRQRVAEQYAANFQSEAESYQADQGADIAYRLSNAPEDAKPVLRDELTAHLNQLRAEMPKDKANAFFLQRSLAPAVNSLITKKKFDEAAALLAEVETLDVTGSGGILGSTAAGRQVIATLSDRLEAERMQDRNSDLTTYRASVEAAKTRGQSDALNAVLELKKAGQWSLDPQDIERTIAEYSKGASGSEAGLTVNAFADALRTEMKQEINARYEPFAIAPIREQAQTYNTAQLDAAEALLEQKRQSWQVSAQEYQETRDLIRSNRAAASLMVREVEVFRNDLYTGGGADALGGKQVKMGTLSDADQKLWEGLTPELREQHEIAMVRRYREALEARIQQEGNTEEVRSKIGIISREVAKEVRPQAVQVLRDLTTVKVAQTNEARITEQAKALAQAKRGLFAAPTVLNALAGKTKEPSAIFLTFEAAGKEVSSPKKTGTYSFVPGAGPDLAASIAAQKTKPMSEWDVVATPSYFYNTRETQALLGKPLVLDLKDLAKEYLAASKEAVASPATGNPGRASVALEFYGRAKSLLGFTPEEITAGQTKHGVPFAPGEVDPKRIPVFRSKEELEANWNKGDPTELFYKVGDALDPNDKLTPEAFYSAQLALLSTRR